MKLQLKQLAVYVCRARDWRTIEVLVGAIRCVTAQPVVDSRHPHGNAWRITVCQIPVDSDGTPNGWPALSYQDVFRVDDDETWENIAHNLMTEEGWYSPWEATP